MKKIISLVIAFAMLATASTAVFAQVPADAAAKATVTITDTGTTYEAYGIYSVQVDLADLGTLNHSQGGVPVKYSGTKVCQVNFQLNGDAYYNSDVAGALGSGFSGTGQSSEFNGIYVSFADAAAKTAYPSTVGTVNKCDNAINFTLLALPGTQVTVSNLVIGYQTYTNSVAGGVNYGTASFNGETSFTLGGVEPAALAMDVALQINNSNGYIWKADVTKGETDPTSLTADFTTLTETAHREIRNISELTSKFSGGTLSFHIGLKTTKTLTGASFTITDANGSVTATGAVSK